MEPVPSNWKLNGFSTRKFWFDPFESYKDGIYQITSEQYEEFNMFGNRMLFEFGMMIF